MEAQPDLRPEPRRRCDEKRTFPDGAVDRITCCGLLKTEALKKTLSRRVAPLPVQPRHAGSTSVDTEHRAVHRRHRRARGPTRRAAAPRSATSRRATADNAWDVGEQPPEFWNQYKTDFAPGHPRADPPAARLDRAEHLGVHRAGEHSHGVALLRPGRRAPATARSAAGPAPSRSSPTARNVAGDHRGAARPASSRTSPSGRAGPRTRTTAAGWRRCGATATCDTGLSYELSELERWLPIGAQP